MDVKEKSFNDEIAALKNIIAQKEREIFSLKNIIDNVPGDVYWKDQDGVYTGINAMGRESLRKMGFAWKASDIVGKTDYDLYEKQTADVFRENDLQIMQSGIKSLREEEAILPSGEKIVQLSIKTPLWNEQGNVVGIVGNTIDITYLKEIEEKLRTAKEKAEKAHQAEQELRKIKVRYQLAGAKLISGSIAHEIRTPLATIQSAICGMEKTLSKLISVNQLIREKNLAVDSISDDEINDLKESIDVINRKIDESNGVINMLLTNLQSLNFEFTEFSIDSACNCVQDALNEFPVSQEIRNKISFNTDSDFKFLGNHTLVMHVIMNLIEAQPLNEKKEYYYAIVKNDEDLQMDPLRIKSYSDFLKQR